MTPDEQQQWLENLSDEDRMAFEAMLLARMTPEERASHFTAHVTDPEDDGIDPHQNGLEPSPPPLDEEEEKKPPPFQNGAEIGGEVTAGEGDHHLVETTVTGEVPTRTIAPGTPLNLTCFKGDRRSLATRGGV